MSNSSYSDGRRDALFNAHPPCGNWLRQQGYVEALDRHHYLVGFRHEKGADALAPPFDPLRYECRCGRRCGEELPYPYQGA